MKKQILILSLLLLTVILNAQNKPFRWYPFHNHNRIDNISREDSNRIFSLPVITSSKDSTMFFAPSITVNAFTLNTSDKTYEIGAIPGIGYGLKWNPYKWKENYLIGIDLFMKAALEGDNDPKYFGIQVSPAITILNWFTIGYGPEFRLGVKGEKNSIVWLFRFGISKSL